MNVNELKQKRAALVEQSRAMTEIAVKEKRTMTDEEHANVDKVFAEIRGIETTIKQIEHQKELDRSLAENVAKTDEEQRAVKKGSDVNDAFRSYLKQGNFGDGKGAEELRALQADIDTAGGFTLAPQQFVNQLIKGVDDLMFIRQKAQVFRITGTDSLGAPSLSANPADATWTGEITAVSEDSTMAFGKRNLAVKPLAKLLKVSRKLLQTSALPIDQIIAERMAYINALPQEKAFLTGSGAGQPLGLFTASAEGISTSRDVSTGNTTTAFTVDGLIETKYSVKSQYHRTAEWIFHRDAVKMLAKLKDGDGQYLWKPAITEGQPDMLLGSPVNMSENAPNTFTTGLYVGLYGDLSHYWIAESNAIEVQRLNELYAATNQVGFICRSHVDGMPVLEEAFARVKLA